jgi:hypothetical protein
MNVVGQAEPGTQVDVSFYELDANDNPVRIPGSGFVINETSHAGQVVVYDCTTGQEISRRAYDEVTDGPIPAL